LLASFDGILLSLAGAYLNGIFGKKKSLRLGQMPLFPS
jgi:hypothetical protein